MTNTDEKTVSFADRLLAQTLWSLCRGVAVMPYWMQYYVLQEIICFVLKRIIRYRRKLIIRQLTESFPERSAAEIRDLCSKYYDTLAEWVVDTLTMAGMSDEQCARRVTFIGDADAWGKVCEGRNIVGLTSHYGFWEYYSFVAQWTRGHHLVAAYHELKNPAMNLFYSKLRQRNHVSCVSSSQFMRFYLNNRNGIDGRNLYIGLISDQNSAPRAYCRWYRFLNHDSLFFDGGEQLALRFGLPVYYFEMDRIRRGYYTCRFRMIYDGVEQVEPHEITERYVRSLEETIQRRPELWMWSHNRWKFRRECIDNPVVLNPGESGAER